MIFSFALLLLVSTTYYRFLAPKAPENLGIGLLIAASSFLIGTFIFCGFVWLTHFLQAPLTIRNFHCVTITTGTGLTVLLLATRYLAPPAAAKVSESAPILPIPVPLALIGALLCSAYIIFGEVVAMTPIFAWDVLQGGEWGTPSYAQRAIRILQLSEQPIAWDPYHYRHPPPSFILLAAESLARASGTYWLFGGVWWALLISAATGALAITKIFHGSGSIFCVTALMILTLPLAENHALAPGYNDLILAVSLSMSSSMFCLYFLTKDVATLLLGLLLCACVYFSKSIGPIVAISQLVAVLLTRALQSKSISIRSCCVVSVCMLAAPLALFCIMALVAPQTHSTVDILNRIIPDVIFSRSFEVTIIDTQLVVRNLFTALVENQSFSVVPALLIVALIAGLPSSRRITQPHLMLLVLFIFQAHVLLAYQLLDYGAATSAPNSDTLFSRLLMPSVLAFLANMPVLMASYRPRAKTLATN